MSTFQGKWKQTLLSYTFQSQPGLQHDPACGRFPIFEWTIQSQDKLLNRTQIFYNTNLISLVDFFLD